jgi:ribonuclease P protein component
VALPASNRLKSRKDFQAVFQKGIRRHGTYLTLRALRPSTAKEPSLDAAKTSLNLPPTRIGISISTKVSKRAVVRNRIKRQITTALYEWLADIAPGWQIAIVVKPTAAEDKCDRQQFLQELKQLLLQTEVLNGHS